MSESIRVTESEYRAGERAQREIAKQKSTAREFTEKAVVILSAAAVGAGIGYVNAANGATAETPYMIGATAGSTTGLSSGVGVDLVAAGAGVAAILACPANGKSSELMPAALGAGAAAIGIAAQRQAYAWELTRSQAVGSGSTATSQGWGGSMNGRMAPPGVYGNAAPYVGAYASR